MPHIEFDISTQLSPKQVQSLLLDFSSHRPESWPQLAFEEYEVYQVDATSADVKEGSRRPFLMWEKDHYDWSTPGHVRWTVEESNYCTPGSYVDVAIRPEAGGGSKVHVAWDRSGVGMKGKILIGLVTLTHGETIKQKVFQQAFDRLLRSQLQSR